MNETACGGISANFPLSQYTGQISDLYKENDYLLTKLNERLVHETIKSCGAA